MNLTDLKLYCLNATTFTISLTDLIEPKWYAFKKDRNKQ